MARTRSRTRIKTVGAPDWMATYADMMSLLLTFFILLFSVAEEQTEKVYEVYKSFQVYFKLDKVKTLGYYPKKISLSKIQGYLENSIRPPSAKGNRGRSRSYREEVEEVGRYASDVKQRFNHLNTSTHPVPFSPGSAKIDEETFPLLLKIAGWLQSKNLDILIVGHTSTVPLGPTAETEDSRMLGYLRAMAVARFLSGQTHGDLSALVRASDDQSLRLLAGKIKNIAMDRITVASQAAYTPSPARRELWEDPFRDDRVEILFLPE